VLRFFWENGYLFYSIDVSLKCTVDFTHANDCISRTFTVCLSETSFSSTFHTISLTHSRTLIRKMQGSDPHEVALQDAAEDLLLAAARTTQALADFYALSGEQGTSQGTRAAVAAEGAEAAAAAAEALIQESETRLGCALSEAEQNATDCADSAAAEESKLASTRANVESEDRRYVIALPFYWSRLYLGSI
jgi:hypothetical protein